MSPYNSSPVQDIIASVFIRPTWIPFNECIWLHRPHPRLCLARRHCKFKWHDESTPTQIFPVLGEVQVLQYDGHPWGNEYAAIRPHVLMVWCTFRRVCPHMHLWHTTNFSSLSLMKVNPSSTIYVIKPFVKNSLEECVTGSHFATTFWFASWRGSGYRCMGMCFVGCEVFCL